MPLTAAQLQALKVAFAAETAAVTVITGYDAQGEPVTAALAVKDVPRNGSNAQVVAAWYNQPAVPDFRVWRTEVTKREIVTAESTDPDGTTRRSFLWAGNGFITRSVGELECWNQLFNSTLACSPSLPNVRQAFQDIFSGTGNAASNRQHLLNVCQRPASRVEKLLAAGTGTPASPATMGAEGPIAGTDVEAAWAA